MKAYWLLEYNDYIAFDDEFCAHFGGIDTTSINKRYRWIHTGHPNTLAQCGTYRRKMINNPVNNQIETTTKELLPFRKITV